MVASTAAPAAAAPTHYRCPDSGIEATFGADCVPLDLYLPDRLFGLPYATLAGMVCDALNTGAVWSQQRRIELEDATGDVAAGDAAAGGARFDSPPYEHPPVEGDAVGTGPWDTDPDSWGTPAPPAGPVDVDACMERLHGVADLLADAHLELQTARYHGQDAAGQVRAGANSAGAIVELEVSPQFAARGTVAGTEAVLEAAAAAVRAANRARAEVIERALGAILRNSLAGRRHEPPGYL